jgi:hypothetical protein
MKKIVVILAAILSSTVAFGHSHMMTSEPKAGSTVSEAPSQVVLHLSEALESKFSKIEVTDDSGARVDDGTSSTDDGNQTLKVTLKPALKPGKYHVKWKATAIDTHKSSGRFDFTVKAGP